MNSENKAKIREALRACQIFISSLNTGGEKEWEKAKGAVALLDAEDKPSVRWQCSWRYLKPVGPEATTFQVEH